MKRIGLTVAAMLAIIGSDAAGNVQAQMMGPYNPPIDPSINIIRGGAPPAINYFNLVQPLQQFNTAIGALESQQTAMGQAMGQSGALGTTTGHPVMFGSYMQYYNPRGALSYYGGGGMGMGGMGMGGMGGMGMGGMGGMGMGGMGGMGMGGMGGMGMGGMGMGR